MRKDLVEVMNGSLRSLWVVGGVALVAACNQNDKVRLTLDQVVMPPETGAHIEKDALIRPVNNGYLTVSSGKTKGTFPCALAVARVSAPADVTTFAAGATLDSEPLDELIDWMGLWDDVWLVSEVVPITYPVRKDRAVTVTALLRQAREDGAGLCLIYAIDDTPVADGALANVYGEIYDARSEKLLARMHADAHVLSVGEDELPPLPPPDRVEVDRRHIDPWFVAQRRFEESTRQCVLDLIERDERPPAPPDPPRRAESDRTLQTYPVNPWQ